MNKRVFCSGILMIFLCVSLLAQTGFFSWPDTPAGRLAAGYFKAMNSRDDAELKAYFEAAFSPEALAQRPMPDRLARSRSLQAEMGRIEPQQVVAQSADRLVILARGEKGGWFEFSFRLDPSAADRLQGIAVIDSYPPESDNIAPPKSLEELPRTLDTLLKKKTADGEFSGVVLVARGSAVLFEEAYGLADRAFSVPMRKDTRFNLGSINKMFTKVAVAKLLEQGRLSLDDTLGRFLPDYPNKDARDKVTVRMLVNHTSGIGDFFNEAYQALPKDRLRHNRDYLPLFDALPLLFEPGSSERYSNGGYAVLGAVIEKASGKDYYDFIRETVYGPAGMKDTDSYEADVPVPNIARGYTQRGEGESSPAKEARDNIYSRPARGSAAGGGYSTAEDMLRFVEALKSGKLLGREATAWILGGPEPGRAAASEKAMAVGPGPSLAFAGGAPGINSAVEIPGDFRVIVLTNLDPPAAMRIASRVSRWLTTLGPAQR